MSVVMLDADKFKNVNDTYGHATGDLVLIRLAEIVREVIRAEDSFGRFGGEEFVLALPETDANSAMLLAERIRALIEATVVPSDEGDVRFTVSFGVATRESSSDAPDLHTLLNQADEALYQAKETGRNKVIHYKELPASKTE
jgi:diguanylate cyclase (GGDEF)-like protein